MTRKRYDFIVIGAGIVGALLARELCRYGQRVCIVDKESDVATGATKANSAIVHAGFDAEPGTLKALLNVRGAERMESLCKELGVKYKRTGALVVGFNETDRETIRDLYDRGQKNGVKQLAVLEQDKIREIEPNIGNEVICALYAPTSGIVCPYQLCIAAVGNAMDNGADLQLGFEVTRIEYDGCYYVYSGDRVIASDYVINCAGVNSDHIAGMAGDHSFVITPKKGEYLLYDKAIGNLVSHTIFRCPDINGKGILVTPTVDGNLLSGPTASDSEGRSDTDTTPVGFDQIRSVIVSQVRNIDFSKVITSFAGLRAKGDTGDFIINSPAEHFYNVAGIESPGLSAAPAIAEYVVELIGSSGKQLEINKDFNPVRRSYGWFKKLSSEEKSQVIKKDPAFGHVICRCETVTEGEIRDAIRRHPKPSTIDGVKRRTRSTMGRCQGGFCSPYIVEVLTDELGLEPEAVTKSGGNSFVIMGRTKDEA